MNKKLDFLLVGFCKSGTSSLDAALRQDRRIMLSETKETQYISNHEKLDMDNFWNIHYPCYRKNKCIGGIEPTYCFHAKKVREVFGGDIKLVFMMRNPIKAHFSQFKMRLRGEGNLTIDKLYKKYSANQLSQMYEYYVRNWTEDSNCIKDDFLYDKWIKEYLKYYDIKQMHFIIFEDFILDPQRVINELQNFLGLEPRRINIIEKKNFDVGISKNLPCRLINKRVSIWVNRWRNYPCLRSIFIKLRRICYQHTLVQNNEPMNNRTEDILRGHYKNTIFNIEGLLQRDLKQVW